MRIRTALLGAVIAVGAVLGFASPASAAESVGACVAEVAHELEELMAAGMSEEEAIEEVEAEAEACVEAPNPVLPELNELIWISIAFAVLLAIGLKFAYPAVAKSMEDRSERIRSDLEAAERAKEEALAEQARYQESLGDARGEANRIIEEARAQAEALRSERATAAEAEAAEIRSKAQADAESIKAQALADVRRDLTELALGAAERVVGRSLDAESQSQLIDDYINQVGSQN